MGEEKQRKAAVDAINGIMAFAKAQEVISREVLKTAVLIGIGSGTWQPDDVATELGDLANRLRAKSSEEGTEAAAAVLHGFAAFVETGCGLRGMFGASDPDTKQ
ncbi:hypothetical protein [Afipia carboxidovorans]|uniref:hypothetical protein n=1 Tax=Afipia carboxidovorans TaxID=40137 RepID=UPI00308F66FF|nr:hypothetical protein CRBSH125_01330 [Afipia carboxidovorans]